MRMLLLAALLALAAGCGGPAAPTETPPAAPTEPATAAPTEPATAGTEQPTTPEADSQSTAPAEDGRASAGHPWLETELTDVLSGETFRLAEFAGRLVVVESMAVWCPLCTTQQKHLAAARSTWGEEVIVVSLDTDPAEDAEILRRHAQSHGFDWLWAVAPREMSAQLSATFGPEILSAPSTPIFWLDEQLEPHLLPFGIKPAAELLARVGTD